jgi:hypothetical protein
MEITLSIIGTAGRDSSKPLGKSHFEAMCLVASGLIDQLANSNYPITHLVSGGAAWADHVAVKLFLNKKSPNLRLYLPAAFEGGSFHDNGSEKWNENPGRTANHYHKQFQVATHIHSLSEINIAKCEGATLIEMGGFHARNAMVAKSDFLLAMTFGKGSQVKPGGTADTVDKYLTRVRKEGIFDKSFHYNLNDGKIYEGCTLPPKSEQFGKNTAIFLNKFLGKNFKNSP